MHEVDPRELEFINEWWIIHKLFDKIKEMIIYIFTRHWESLDIDTKRYKEKGFTDVYEYKSMWKRKRDRFLKDYDYKRKKRR